VAAASGLCFAQCPLALASVLKRSCIVTLSIALASCAAPRGQGVSGLPSAGYPESRFSDAVIGADLAYFEKLQQRLARLPAEDPPQRYHGAKALAWLALARGEYENSDRSPAIENATAQAESLIGALERRSATINPETPLIPGSERIRKDLWQKAARAKQHTGFRCAAPTVAQLEVQLAWAAHELTQTGWRGASAYIQGAEDLGQRVERELAGCGQAG
jgi:OmpA-OmpF porin, OOP family